MMQFPQYESYKDSGIEWLGNVPIHWKLKKIKYSCYVKGRVGWHGLSSDEYSDEGAFLITGTNFSNGIVDWESCHHISFKRYEEDKYIQLKENDLLITKDGTIGKLAVVNKLPDKATLNSGIFLVRSLSSNLNIKFLKYLLFSNVFYKFLDYFQTGATVKHLYQETFGNFQYLLPDLEEQQKIVDLLDKKTAEIDEAIAKKQKLIELLQEQKAILINRAVTKGLNPNVSMRDSGIKWIGEIPEHWSVLKNRYIFTEINKRSEKGSELHLCMSQKLGLVPSDQVKNKPLQSESYEGAKLCSINDIVLNRLKAHLGVFSVSFYDGLVSPDYSVFRLQNSQMKSKYFEHLFKTNAYISEFNKRVKGIVVGFYRLYTGDFYDIPCILPPVEEQCLIEKWVQEKNSQVNNLKREIQKEIDRLNELKQILISNAVTGKIKI